MGHERAEPFKVYRSFEVRRDVRLAGMIALLAISLGVLRCSLTVDADRLQCKVNSDCASRGASFAHSLCVQSLCQPDPKWSCFSAPPPPDAGAGPFSVRVHLVDAVTQAVLSGVTAQLCRKIDVTCANALDTVQSDVGGLVTFSITGGFDGYVLLTDARIASALYFFNPPIDRDQDVPPVPLASPAVVQAIIGQVGVPLADHGIILLTTSDCNGATAGGITYSVAGDPSTFAFYLVDGLPTTAVNVTDQTGYGGLVNVPPGTSAVTATVEAEQRTLGMISLLVREGYVTYSRISRMMPIGH